MVRLILGEKRFEQREKCRHTESRDDDAATEIICFHGSDPLVKVRLIFRQL